MTGRDGGRALAAVAAAVAVFLAAALLAPFGAAAPAGQVVDELAGTDGGSSFQFDGDGPTGPGGLAPPKGGGGPFGLSLPGGLGGAGGSLLDAGTGLLGTDAAAEVAAEILRLFAGGGGGGEPRDGPGSGSGSGEGRDAPACRYTDSSDDLTVCIPEGETLYPGTSATVAVFEDGEPVDGVTVFVNGDRVGATDDGAVTFTVPYAAELRVAVQRPGAAARDRRFAFAARAPATADLEAPVESGVTVEVAGDADPGSTVRVRAAFDGGDGPPLAGATVTLDGEAVAETNARGVATVTLPAAETTTLAVERGDVRAARDLRLVSLAVQVTGDGPLGIAVPGSTGTLRVTEDGAALTDATVRLAGTTVGRTDRDGAVRAALPFAPRTTVVVETPSGVTVERTVYPYPLLTLLSVLGIVGLVAVGYLWRRSAVSGRTLAAEASSLVTGLADRAGTLLVGTSDALLAAARRVRARVRAVADAVRAWGDLDPVDAVRDYFRARWAALVDRLAATVERGRERARSAVPDFGEDEVPADDDGGTDRSLTPRERVEAAWAAFVDRVGVRRARTQTPGMVARRARDAGYPADAVRRLTGAFRAVEYADDDPSTHVETAESAAAELTDEEGESA